MPQFMDPILAPVYEDNKGHSILTCNTAIRGLVLQAINSGVLYNAIIHIHICAQLIGR